MACVDSDIGETRMVSFLICALCCPVWFHSANRKPQSERWICDVDGSFLHPLSQALHIWFNWKLASMTNIRIISKWFWIMRVHAARPYTITADSRTWWISLGWLLSESLDSMMCGGSSMFHTLVLYRSVFSRDLLLTRNVWHSYNVEYVSQRVLIGLDKYKLWNFVTIYYCCS